MKKFLALLGVAVFSTSLSAQNIDIALSDADLQAIAISAVEPLDLINWKVGDTASYDVKVGSFGKLGTSKKFVAKDEGTALWIEQHMDLMIQKQKIEILINKADGKVLKTIVNGKEQNTPEDPLEIISQDYEEVTVPAGTFNAIHIIAKTKQIERIEVWANPRDTVMDGALKQAVKAQGMDIVMELTSFKRG
jgi:hypothetical protein